MRTVNYIFIVSLCLVESGICSIACGEAVTAEHEKAQSNSTSELTWRYSYDDAGQITHMVGPGGKETKIRYELDGKGHVQQMVAEFSDSTSATLWFDQFGRRVSMTDAAGTVRYEYDGVGHLAAARRDGAPAVCYTYDTSDRIKTLKVGNFYCVEYVYDFLGRLEKMDTPAGVVSYDYQTGQGRIIRTLPNGFRTIWEYTPDGSLQSIAHVAKDNHVIAQFQYDYRPDGLIHAIKEFNSGGEKVTQYEYDNVQRLAIVTNSRGEKVEYHYDRFGNRLEQIVNGERIDFSEYDWAGRMTKHNGQACIYDAAGNLTSYVGKDDPHSFGFNAMNLLKSAAVGDSKVEYEYDGDGYLIARVTGGKKTTLIPDPLADIWRPLLTIDPDGRQTLYVWQGDIPLLVIRGGKTRFLLADHLGSIRLIVDVAGQVVQRMEYGLFGELQQQPNDEGLYPSYAGLFCEPVGELCLTRARAFDPTLGRFLQRDPHLVVPWGEQKSLSTYIYCGADPLNFIDVSGAEARWVWGPENWVWQAVHHLFDVDVAKKYYAQKAESTLASAGGLGIAAGLTATFWDLVGGYIPGNAPRQEQAYASMLWSLVPVLGTASTIGVVQDAALGLSVGRGFSSALVNTAQGHPVKATLDIAGLWSAQMKILERSPTALFYQPNGQYVWGHWLPSNQQTGLISEYKQARDLILTARIFGMAVTAPNVRDAVAGVLEFGTGQFLNFLGKDSYWIGANRGGNEFSWAKDSLGRFPLGDTTVGVKNRADEAAKWHDIQDWVNWHADKGVEVKVPWGDGSFKYFISRGKESSDHNWEVLQFASGLRSDYPISDSPRTPNPVDLSVLREKYPVSGSTPGVTASSTSGGKTSPERIYRTDRELPEAVHRTMVEQALQGLAFDGVKDPSIIAYGETKEDAEAMKAVVLGYNRNAKVVLKWGSDDLRGADVVFEMRSKANGGSRRAQDKRSRRNDIFIPPPGGGGGGGGGGGWPPPPPGGGGALMPSHVGGVYLASGGHSLDGVGLLEGVTLDRNGNLVLLSKAGDEIKLPPLRLDDVVTVFRSVYLHGEGPMVTIDPNPENPEGSAMIIKHSKATEDTYVGWVLYQADRLMKGYTLGVDNLIGRNVESSVPGYREVVDTIYFGGENPEKQQQEGHWERFWIVPAEARRFGAPRSELTLFDVPLKVNTQTMKWEKGELVDDILGKSSPGALAFTNWFTTNYDLVARERFLTPPPESGITEPVPIYTELRRIALITAIAEKLRDQGVPLPFWMRDYEVRPVPFERTTPGLKVTRANQKMVARIFGGVNLSSTDENLRIFTAKADLSKLSPSDQKSIGEKVALAGSLEQLIQTELISAEPLKVQTIKHQGVSHQVVALPGSETRALAPCRLDEVDLEVTIEGGRAIQLVRSYNSFFDPTGPWGKGWVLDLPHLNEIKVPVQRDAKQVQYQVAYELITPLNSMYSRFNRIEEVSELNGSRLQVPDQTCEFFGLADARPEFLSGPTHQLIRKDGGAWHFSQAGDLVATEQGGFRTVYERDEKGRLMRIVGLLGRRIAASIELHYDEAGKLDSAKAGGSQPESSMRYEYDNTGRLVGVLSDSGRLGYRYNGSWVTAVTFRAGAGDDKKAEETTMRRFEYNACGQLVAEVDATGARAEYRVTSDSKGNQITVTYSSSISKVDSVRYDHGFRPVEAKYANGTRASWSYPDGGGVILELSGSDGQNIRLRESADRRRRTLELGKERKVTGEYDAAGRLTSITENGHTLLQQEWSPDGCLLVTSNETCAAHTEYDHDGLVSRVLLAPPGERGQFKRWQEMKLDPAGRLREITDCRGLQVLVDYDGSGELGAMVCKRDGKNYGFQINRDQSGRIQEVKSSWGTERYAYDAAGALERADIERNGKKATIEWKSGLVRKLTQFDAGEVQLDYRREPSRQGLLQQVQMPNNLRLSYDYDPDNRLRTVDVGGTYRMEFVYDSQGRLSSLSQSPWSK